MRCLVIYLFAHGHHFKKLASTVFCRIWQNTTISLCKVQPYKDFCSDLCEEENVCLFQWSFADHHVVEGFSCRQWSLLGGDHCLGLHGKQAQTGAAFWFTVFNSTFPTWSLEILPHVTDSFICSGSYYL